MTIDLTRRTLLHLAGASSLGAAAVAARGPLGLRRRHGGRGQRRGAGEVKQRTPRQVDGHEGSL